MISALTRFRTALGERFGERLREVRLFGSQARGEANEDSDVDVFVSVDGLTGAERSEILTLAYHADLAGEEDVLLSPLAYSTEQADELRRRERRLLRDIDREGVAL
ncbi:MAG TPA: nucleotidyltransferase domain-containing protein [Polyangiaceae bacterium]